MAQITNFFLGANSGSGFQDLFSEIMDLEDTFDLMILKGGPGVGKNTFMREIGRAMEEAGTDVEYLHCSGDPDSLDGVVIPAIRCAVCDGTSPHGMAPLGHLVATSSTSFVPVWYPGLIRSAAAPLPAEPACLRPHSLGLRLIHLAAGLRRGPR